MLGSDVTDQELEAFHAPDQPAGPWRADHGRCAQARPRGAIKDGYTFGRTALQYQTAQKKKPGSHGKSFARLKEAGAFGCGCGLPG